MEGRTVTGCSKAYKVHADILQRCVPAFVKGTGNTVKGIGCVRVRFVATVHPYRTPPCCGPSAIAPQAWTS